MKKVELSDEYKQKLEELNAAIRRMKEEDKREALTEEQQIQLDEMIEGEIDEALINQPK